MIKGIYGISGINNQLYIYIRCKHHFLRPSPAVIPFLSFFTTNYRHIISFNFAFSVFFRSRLDPRDAVLFAFVVGAPIALG